MPLRRSATYKDARIESATLKPGMSLESVVPAVPPGDAGDVSARIRGKALIFWDFKVPENAGSSTPLTRIRSRPPPTAYRKASTRSTSAGRPGRSATSCPTSGPASTAARPSLCRRSIRDRILTRDEPGRPQRCCRGGRSGAGDRLWRRPRRHLPPERDQPRAARGPEPRRRARREGRGRVQLRSRRRGVSPTRRRARLTSRFR